jgi:alpha-L-rhamnosidase
MIRFYSSPLPAVLAGICLALPLWAIPAPTDLRVGEGFAGPIGFHDASPNLSWKLPVVAGVKSQSAYRIVAASHPGLLPDEPDLWDSGKVASAESAWVRYAGKSLDSRLGVHWQVMFWDQDGKAASWSAPARFELGLLGRSDWQAQWIRLDPAAGKGTPSPAASIVIEKAYYGEQGKSEHLADVRDSLEQLLAQGISLITANNDLAGRDPIFGVPKSLSLVIVRNGKREETLIPEDAKYDLLSGAILGEASNFVPQHLRREFVVGKPLRSARLHVTARGVFEVRLNGGKVGNDFMAPGWTPYTRKIETLTYDVTRQLREGANAIGAILGEGWYAGRLGWEKGVPNTLKPHLLVQLELTHADGTTSTIATDSSWKATDKGPIRFSGIYDGENYDARKDLGAWDTAGFDDSNWQPVATENPASDVALAPKRHHPVRVTKNIPAIAVTEPKPGRFVFDLGQNIVGWPVLKIPVRKNQVVTVRFAEMLEKNGTLYTANYRSAKSANTYTAATDGIATWHPTFTFHGFRYVELSGFPAGTRPSKEWVTGSALHSDFGWSGTFTSSHQMLNQLQSNITWGLRGNFLDIPTDCPQRDERLGWTGDAQVFTPAALFNADVHAFLASWLESMRLDQQPDGAIPSIVPDVKGILGNRCGGPGWSDAATVIPWELYIRTGDRSVLEENFDMMRRWVGWYESKAAKHIIDVNAWGDWLQPNPASGNLQGDTPRQLIGTAYFARSADLTAQAARRLGKTAEAERLEALFTTVKSAFTAKFFDGNGKLTTANESQTGYLLALGFDLLPEPMRAAAAENLVRLVGAADGHLRTGFLGTPLLAPVLDRFGHTDLAYQVLFKETYPSWFYSIHQGATTMWERWNSYSHADGFGNAGMNSFNHYSYGAIGQWMHERIAGLAPDPAQPGYKHFFIQPAPGGPLTSARAELMTPYGKASSAWILENRTLKLEAIVPPNTTATLVLPGKAATELHSGRHVFQHKLP